MGAGPARVLVTGLNGFTGLHLEASLRANGYEVHGTVREGEATDDRRHVAELTDPAALRDLISKVQPTHVVHLAAISFVAHGDIDDMYRTNVVGTSHLLRALADAGGPSLRTVLLASSANVYGNTEVDPIDESQPFRPANDYAVSKVAMEYMASLWSDRLPLTIVRPFNYTGAGQSKQFLIPKIVDAYARRAPFLELGNIDVERDFSDVRDVVGAYCALLDKPPQGVLNVCSGVACSLRRVLAMAEEISGHSLEVRVNPAFVRANEVHRLRGSAARLEARLGAWSPRPLRDTLGWMLEV